MHFLIAATIGLLLFTPTSGGIGVWSSALAQPTADMTSPVDVVYAGEVFVDLNRNGIREQEETGMQNVTIRIETLEGELLDDTTSDEDGVYIFSDLPEPMVRVRILPPALYAISANGDYIISTTDPQSPTVRSTGLFIGVFFPQISGT
ncbi:MAG: SdrD B-like domain-containing protein [Caldilineaceae bacterium]